MLLLVLSVFDSCAKTTRHNLCGTVLGGSDGGGCGPQIIVSNTRGDRPNPGRPALAAATLEAANGMTSHSKTCYADIVKCLARR